MSDDVNRLNGELNANRQRWYHDDQSRTECVAGHDLETRECSEGGGRVFSEVEYLTQLVEIWTGLTRSYEGDVAELRAEVDHLKTELAEMESAAADWAARSIEQKGRISRAESRIAEALDLASRLDPTSGHGRVRAFISDLRNVLRGGGR